MIPLRWTYAGDAGKRLASDGHFVLPTPSVTPQLKKNEKKQADFDNLGAKLQARRAITRPAMEQARKQKADDEEAAGKRSSTPLRDAFANAAGEFVQDGLKEGSKALGKEFRRQFRVGANPWQAAAANLARLR